MVGHLNQSYVGDQAKDANGKEAAVMLQPGEGCGVTDVIWTMLLVAMLSRSYWWSGFVLTHHGHRVPCLMLIFCEIVQLHQKTTGAQLRGPGRPLAVRLPFFLSLPAPLGPAGDYGVAQLGGRMCCGSHLKRRVCGCSSVQLQPSQLSDLPPPLCSVPLTLPTFSTLRTWAPGMAPLFMQVPGGRGGAERAWWNGLGKPWDSSSQPQAPDWCTMAEIPVLSTLPSGQRDFGKFPLSGEGWPLPFTGKE